MRDVDVSEYSVSSVATRRGIRRNRAVARSRRNVASSESPLPRGYRDPQHRTNAVLRSARTAEETLLRRREGFSLVSQTAVPRPNHWSFLSTWINLFLAKRFNGSLIDKQ